MVGAVVGFILGVVVAGMISPLILNSQLLIPISVVSCIGFPVLLCTRRDMKGLWVTVGLIIACIIVMTLILNLREAALTRKAMEGFE